ncbi:V-type ATPase subunit [Thermus thermophilus]|uniref:V-type ATP synthase subunit C n=2 Tax=Thermus TaxID=270 RepID=VATC_THET2|nr:V-type ATPase subunit [Thermus thermophilus]Q72J70.1 RecName: Full=V-type ATP synthase subunit C; AltName: Full=V-ATPase subunit C [Thermus thermophilus HB27]AAS81253.1 V-type ATP synthase subunit C [Thermus thermophilus HB27]QMV30965.1 V-type ATP synthase subunit C [Thermus thermophilus]WMV96283.1 V-type ATPase subunit [Thermus thermophilus HB27]
MADDFAYLNARVRVRRGTLLKESFFQEALDLSFADFLRLLSETVYGGELAGQGLPDVDRAVLRTQAKLVGDLPRLVTGEAREAVRLLLLRNDLHNLQALLRAKATGRPFEEVLLLPGTLREEVWRQAYEAQDPAGMAQVLAVPGHPLARALRAVLRETQDLARVEALLAKRFFEDVAKAAKGLDQPALRDYLALEVDAENLRTAFKLQGSGLAPDAFFLKGGRFVDRVRFARLMEGDYAVLDELSGTPFSGLSGVRDLRALERGLRCVLLKEAKKGVQDPLGVGLVLAYVKEREWEAVRLRLLARRAYFGLPRAQVEEEVVCP